MRSCARTLMLFVFATYLAGHAFVASASGEDELPIVSGYAGSWSLPSGQPAEFFLSGIENPSATLNIFDVHYKPIASVTTPIRPQSIAEDNLEPWVNGLGYEPQMLDLPDLHSGIYYLDGPEMTSNRIPFLINNHDEVTDIVVIYPTNTVNAYSRTQNVNLYTKIDGVRPKAVSFLRPQDTQPALKMFNTRGMDRLLLRAEDYTYKYIADSDLESYDAIAGSKLVIISGHSEYWTETARRNFDQFVSDGGAALAMTGNAMFRSVGYDDPNNPTQLTFSPRTQFTTPSVGYPTWESIGVDFMHGGNGSGYSGFRERITNPHDGWKILNTPSYLADAGVEIGDVIHAPAAEYDGVPYTECDPFTGPVIDRELLGFHEIDLIAFENTSYGGQRPTCGAWIDFRKTELSGRQITVGAFNATLFGGRTGQLQSQIASNMIVLLLIDQGDFDGDERLTSSDIDLLTEAIHDDEASLRFDMTMDNLIDHEDLDRWLFDFAKTLPGDANVDGIVDNRDFLMLAHNFRKEVSVWSQGDFDANRFVDFSDFLWIAQNFGKSGVGAATLSANSKLSGTSVPEPDGIIPIVIGLLLLRLNSTSRRK